MQPTEYAENVTKIRNATGAAVSVREGADQTGNRFNLPRSTTLPMLVAMNKLGKHIYMGTVGTVEIRRRRVANRVARKQRRTNRLRGA